jgi:hypothetical protein
LGDFREEPAVPRAENENIRRVLRVVREMIALADEGDRDRTDISCGVLYGVLRDMGYRLRRMAEQEREKHLRDGRWD